MKAILGTNYVMAVKQLPNILLCTGIVTILLATKVFKTFLQGVDTWRSCRIFTLQIILNKIKSTKTARYALSLITWTYHFNKPKQSIGEHVTKFTGRSSMRQYLKTKPIKWGFKWWFRCVSLNGYLYEFDFYLGKKQDVKVNLGEGVVMQLSEKLKGTFCTVFW